MADNLFCTAVVLYFLSLVAWLNRPSLWTAAAVGAAIAFAALVKSVALPLCLSTLALMAYSLSRSKCLNKIWRHAAVMFAVTASMFALDSSQQGRFRPLRPGSIHGTGIMGHVSREPQPDARGQCRWPE